MIRAVIFDMDGVLVDATEWHYEALNKALSLFSYSIGRDDHIKVFNGLPTAEKLRVMSEKQGLPWALHDTIKTLKRKYTDEKVNQECRPSHAKQLLLTQLKAKGYKLACCSNAQKYSVMNMLKMAQLDHFFDEIIGNDEGFAPKPAPDIYLAAFKKLRVKPEEVFIVEDAPHGIEAAKASGGNVIEVRGFHDVDLSLFERYGLIGSSKKVTNIKEFTKGWFIGNFEPSLNKTSQFEVGLKRYKKGDVEQTHFHKIAREYTVISKGKFIMKGVRLEPGDIMELEPGEISDFECLEDGETFVIKTPSVVSDKYIINSQ